MNKKLLYAVAACFIFAGMLIAEQEVEEEKGCNGSRKRRCHFDSSKMIERMTKKLNLTDEQKSQVKKIAEENNASVKEIKESDIDHFQKRERVMDLRKGLRAKIDAILTPEQLEQANKNRRGHRRKMERNMRKVRKENLAEICEHESEE